MNLAPARQLVQRHGNTTSLGVSLLTALGMVISYLEARDSARIAREDSAAASKANLELHDRLSRLEGAMTFNRGVTWTNFSMHATEANRAANITPSREHYEQRSSK